ncbi:DUF5667 domain-containing protein [Streptomyces griseus]|uniref:DUF5667 domain-containing protein n=1 Tax=Streptomyces TaxID=1883 RepID=UPI0001C187F5|nr:MULTISPECIES: DUF5667 domain-containing protein [Streptomyces]MYR51795.1 hypothetical protein [Streptomyces sp. SID4928]EGE43758.1 hypothetical protein SACT1_4430 [Streptomyces sp. ACT-1]SCE42372.1 hypothetical protein GA0115261_105242 [Streptomyces sp. OspMP-M43]SEE72492.1 hypothetical protein SAMN04490359_5350 [Streptomyces griseus]SQA27157.1 Uncharacterised protein [Streptomyces griseus]
MIANVSAHRRANAFAQALEEETSQGAAAVQPAEPADQADREPLLALANGLGELPKPQLDPEVKMVQRAQLVAAMETMFAEGGASTGPTVPVQRGKGAHRASPLRKLRPRSRWAKGLTAGGLTVGVAAGAFGGVAAASSDALPGDSLYGLKRGMEDISLGMAKGDADRGEVYLDQASTRLSEARRLMERGRSGALDHESLGAVRRALNGMSHDASEGHRLLHSAYQRDGSIGPIQTLDTFSRSHRDAWSRLRDRLPVQLTDVRDEVSSVFEAMEDEVAPLQSLLPRPPGTDQGTGRSDATTPDTGKPRTDAPAPPASPEKPGDRTDGGTAPDPSGPSDSADATPEDGLLGGGTDGLLDDLPTDGLAPSAPEDRPSAPADPDVTLPPLLPGLLPGLGINGENLKP